MHNFKRFNQRCEIEDVFSPWDNEASSLKPNLSSQGPAGDVISIRQSYIQFCFQSSQALRKGEVPQH